MKRIMSDLLTFEQVVDAIRNERQNQDDKWGPAKSQSLAGYLIIIRKELEEAEMGWLKNLPGKSAPLNELVQVAATCVKCLEQYGATGNTRSTIDIPSPQIERIQQYNDTE